MTLLDILACPICKADITHDGDALRCVGCQRRYPLRNDVPIMLPDVGSLGVQHEGDLVVREGYDPWIPRVIMQSLLDHQVVLDIGCGNMTVDDPCVIRMDVMLTPYVDLVADVHALPFKPGVLDFVFSLAVIEHLRQPFEAAKEIHAALKPGGYVYGECNFVFAYHGFPNHYFNASLHGLLEVFKPFRRLVLGIAPYQMPSFALENLLTTYLSLFRPQNKEQKQFATDVRKLLNYPLRSYDELFPPSRAFRIAAGGYYFGIKQPSGVETIIPREIMSAHAESAELQERYPEPIDIIRTDNLLLWARHEGRDKFAQIDDLLSRTAPFSKHGGSSPPSREYLRSTPVALIPVEPTAYEVGWDYAPDRTSSGDV